MGGTCRWQPANKSGQRNFCLFYFRFNFWIAFWSHCFSTPDLFFLQFFFGLSLLCPLTHCFGFSRLFMIYKKTRRTFLCLIEICESILTTHDKFFFPFYPSHLIFPFPPIFFSLIWIIHKEDENVIWDLLRASWIVVLLGDSIFFFPLALLHALYLSFIPSHSSRCPLPSSFFFCCRRFTRRRRIKCRPFFLLSVVHFISFSFALCLDSIPSFLSLEKVGSCQSVLYENRLLDPPPASPNWSFCPSIQFFFSSMICIKWRVE